MHSTVASHGQASNKPKQKPTLTAIQGLMSAVY